MKVAMTSLMTLGVAAVVAASRASTPAAPLVVHEWGTITTHHAPDGTPRGRLNHINAADTLPEFVHRYEPMATDRDPNLSFMKTALVAGRPDVTMRLETPVIYFYPPRGATIPPFDVSVQFRGGILNEFYPQAGARLTSGNGRALAENIVSDLLWRGVALGDSVQVKPTTSHVWLAPRRVHAAGVYASGEGERYLFYRGVAHLDALLQTRLTSTDVRLAAPRDLRWLRTATTSIPSVWLVDVLPNGSVAFRERSTLRLDRAEPSRELARVPLFANRDYSPAKRQELRASMKRALTSAGLYEEEAEAMLETWNASYFQKPGLRVFYIVPNDWIDYHLPLDVSIPHELTRVLVARIDIETGPEN